MLLSPSSCALKELLRKESSEWQLIIHYHTLLLQALKEKRIILFLYQLLKIDKTEAKYYSLNQWEQKTEHLPIQYFIPIIHVKPEVREGHGFLSSLVQCHQVPSSILCHFINFLTLMPTLITLHIPQQKKRNFVKLQYNREKQNLAMKIVYGIKLKIGIVVMLAYRTSEQP